MKFERKIYKYNARRILKHNYLYIMAVCFIVAFVTNEFRGSTRLISDYNISLQSDDKVIQREQKNNIRAMITGSLDYEKDTSAIKGIGYEILTYFYTDISISGIIISLTIYILFKVVLIVGKCYYLLESRDHIYKKEKAPMVLLLNNFRRNKWRHTSYIMFLRWLYNGLWDLTIIGGIIKYYEYRMIPFILAEETCLSKNEIFKLSKEMVNGYKFKLFVNDLSFIVWQLFEYFTLGIGGILLYVPYKSVNLCEIYLALRTNAIDKKIIYSDNLKADKYISAMNEYRNINSIELDDSIVIKKKEIDLKYKKWYFARVNPARKYKIIHYILFFFSFSVIGWIYEVGIHLVHDGVFVNRGVLHGPWLPIYGTGSIVALILFRRFYKKPILVFFQSMVTASLIEYVTSWYLEMKNGIRWWDYSGYILNLNGRICLLGSVIFGIGGCLVIYVLAPLLVRYYDKILKKYLIIICIAVVTLFLIDAAVSSKFPNTGSGITDYYY